jgi:hypothetical protein
VINKILDNPFVGFAPWIVLSVLVGPGRFELAAGVALALSIVFVVSDVVRAKSIKLLGVVDVVSFAAFLGIGAVASSSQRHWLETWFGEISNIVLVVVVALSMLFRMPFTIQYAREETPREFWNAPVFLRINYTITGVWGLAFLVSAIAGYFGDAVLHNNNNIWTGWIIQIGADLIAVQFTQWYPRYASARAEIAAGLPVDEPAPPVAELALGICAYFIPVGISALSTDAGPWWVGVGFIVAGAAIGQKLRATLPAATAAGEPDSVRPG